MQSYAGRLRAKIEEADYDFVKAGDLWVCRDALLVDEVIAEAPTLGEAIERAAAALGESL